jgi:hypothetical protein
MIGITVAACSSDGASPATDTAPTTVATAAPDTAAPADLAPADFTVRPGTEQVAVLDADPGDELTVVAPDGASTSGTVDEQGALLWRGLVPGDGYVVRSATAESDPFTVASVDDVPDPSLYADQGDLPAGGFGYITTRDGTTLSANVMLPGPADQGPYPTVVEYSGYAPSNPGDSTFAQIYNAMGFAYVGVNMRGTGCSGGSFLYFETVQSLDGYDVIEAVAAQPWVLDGQVGMVGISYPGISQLFVAGAQPPHRMSTGFRADPAGVRQVFAMAHPPTFAAPLHAQPLAGDGRVVRRKDGGMGVELTGFDEAARSVLRALVGHGLWRR